MRALAPVALLLCLAVMSLVPSSAGAISRVQADFNGDGADDLAVGVPDEAFGGNGGAGVVQVIYGGGIGGLTATGNQLWHQDSPGIMEVAEAGDSFGKALTAGDFNGDGSDDLAVAAPSEAFGSDLAVGAVNVIYGSNPGGLTSTGNQVWHQDSPSIMEVAEAFDDFGVSVIAGDFDGDDIDDLAVGAGGERIGGDANAGAVNVIYGSDPAGLSSTGNQVWQQDTAGVMEVAENGDVFGETVVAGDFNADDVVDLAVAASGEDFGGNGAAGVINVIYGTATGLASGGNQVWSQDSPSIVEVAEAGDNLGTTLTAGDFDGDAADDLAVGTPFEDVGGVLNAGLVNVIYGSGTGLTATGNQLWHQDTPAILEVPEENETFARSLSAGDFDGDLADDLAVGVTGDSIGGNPLAGAVNVIYGADPGGLSATGNQLWSQDSSGILEVAGPFEHFGFALSVGDFDNDGTLDLAVGSDDENLGSIDNAGSANAIYGSNPAGLTSTGNQLWHQDSPGILEVAEDDDSFGAVLNR